MNTHKMSDDRQRSSEQALEAARTHRAALVAGVQSRLGTPDVGVGALVDAISPSR